MDSPDMTDEQLFEQLKVLWDEQVKTSPSTFRVKFKLPFGTPKWSWIGSDGREHDFDRTVKTKE